MVKKNSRLKFRLIVVNENDFGFKTRCGYICRNHIIPLPVNTYKALFRDRIALIAKR